MKELTEKSVLELKRFAEQIRLETVKELVETWFWTCWRMHVNL